MSILLTLFLEFFKIGLFAVGGGLAAIPFLEELGAKYGWFSSQTLLDMIAISESTPGPIGINMATYTGFHTAGVLGGIIATLGVVIPSNIIIMTVAGFHTKFKDNFYVKSAFYGMRPVVTGMIAATGVGMIQAALLRPDFQTWATAVNYRSVLLFIVMLVLTNKWKIHPVFYIIAAGVVGAVFKF